MIMDKKSAVAVVVVTLKLFLLFWALKLGGNLVQNNTTAAINVSKHKSHEGRHRLLQDAQSAQK